MGSGNLEKRKLQEVLLQYVEDRLPGKDVYVDPKERYGGTGDRDIHVSYRIEWGLKFRMDLTFRDC